MNPALVEDFRYRKKLDQVLGRLVFSKTFTWKGHMRGKSGEKKTNEYQLLLRGLLNYFFHSVKHTSCLLVDFQYLSVSP